MNNFNEMGLPESITKSLAYLKLVKPTPIQAQTIPLALKKRDILGSAQTGTGKTLAFTLPMVKHLLENPHATALVLAPIREIAQQVLRALHDIVGRDFKTALIIGGEPYPKQLSQLKGHPRVIIGTPGRVIDHLERGTLKVNNIDCLVLDETDRMFDMGFGIQLDHIIGKLPTKRHNMMFSATIAPEIEKLAAKYLNNPERVAVGPSTLPVPKIKQEIIKIAEKEKYSRLLHELEQRDGTVLVFVKTKMNADRLAESLRKEDHSASAIHGDLRQRQREKVIKSFSQGKCRIMVATDIAARGLDIPHLMHVINYDVPPCPEDYIHRIGRTGRAGAEGYAMCFVSSQDAKKWNAIERYMEPKSKDSANNRNSRTNSRSDSNFGDQRRSSKSAHPFGDKKPFGEKSRFSSEGKKPFGEKSRFSSEGKKPFGEKDRFSGEGKKPFGEKSRFSGEGKKPFGEKSRFSSEGKKPFGEKDRFSGEGKKPFGEKDRFSGEGKKPFGEKSRFSSEGKKPFGEKDRFSGEGKKPFGEKSRFSGEGKKPFGEKDRFSGEGKKPFGEKSFSRDKKKFDENPNFSEKSSFNKDNPFKKTSRSRPFLEKKGKNSLPANSQTKKFARRKNSH